MRRLAINLIIRRREFNIKLLGDEDGQIFNFKLSILDRLQVVVIIGFFPKFFLEGHRSKSPNMCQDVLDACMDPLLDKTLEVHRDQRDEVAPNPFIIFRSPKKLGNVLKRFSQGGKLLVRYRRLLG
jgi:hypothetical protein